MATWCGAGAFGEACGAGDPRFCLSPPWPLPQTCSSTSRTAGTWPSTTRADFSRCGSTRAPACSSLGTWRCSSRGSWTTPPHPSPGEERLAALTAGGRYWACWGARRRGVRSHVPPWNSGRRPDRGRDVGPACPVLTRTCRRQERRWQQQGVAAVTSSCCWLDGGVQRLQTQVLGRALILQGAPPHSALVPSEWSGRRHARPSSALARTRLPWMPSSALRNEGHD